MMAGSATSSRCWLIVAIAAALIGPRFCAAGTVAAKDGTFTGPVTISPAGVTAKEKSVKWDDVLYVCTGQPMVAASTNAVRFANGDVWNVEIVTLTDGQLTLGKGLLGGRKLSLDGVAALDLGSAAAAPVDGKSNTLLREKGQPVPGTLLWVDGKQLAIESPLGALTLSRSGGWVRYVLSSEASATAKDDQIVLTDGSILCGQAKPVDNGVELQHPLLGKYVIPAANIAAIVRHPAWGMYLTDAPINAKCTPLLTKALLPEIGGTSGEFLASVRIWATCRLEYKLPAGAKSLRTWLLPVDGAKGAAVVRMSVSGKEILRKGIAAESEASAIALDLPAGDTLVIEVDYGPAMAFPCGIVLADPVVVK